MKWCNLKTLPPTSISSSTPCKNNKYAAALCMFKIAGSLNFSGDTTATSTAPSGFPCTAPDHSYFFVGKKKNYTKGKAPPLFLRF